MRIVNTPMICGTAKTATSVIRELRIKTWSTPTGSFAFVIHSTAHSPSTVNGALISSTVTTDSAFCTNITVGNAQILLFFMTAATATTVFSHRTSETNHTASVTIN